MLHPCLIQYSYRFVLLFMSKTPSFKVLLLYIANLKQRHLACAVYCKTKCTGNIGYCHFSILYLRPHFCILFCPMANDFFLGEEDGFWWKNSDFFYFKTSDCQYLNVQLLVKRISWVEEMKVVVETTSMSIFNFRLLLEDSRTGVSADIIVIPC